MDNQSTQTRPDDPQTLELFKQQALWYLNNLGTTPEVNLRPAEGYLPLIELRDGLSFRGSGRPPFSVQFNYEGTCYMTTKARKTWVKLAVS